MSKWLRVLILSGLIGGGAPPIVGDELGATPGVEVDAPVFGGATEPLAEDPFEDDHGDADDGDVDPFDLDIEGLLDVEVEIASKRPQKVSRTASAVHVITREDIRRSGLRSVPELLRLVPGFHVARISAHKWAISARGFNGRFANHLLVLIDGRTVYTPLFSGVHWDFQDLVVEDIERIEVIRGPGGTVWGANAVNGVVNVITRSAKDTQGTYVNVGTGSVEPFRAEARFGDRVGDDLHYRFFGKLGLRDDFKTPGGDDAADEWTLGHLGFRADWDATDADLVTVQGDIVSLREHVEEQQPRLVAPFTENVRRTDDFIGGNVLARWKRELSETSEFTLQTYYDITSLEAYGGHELRQTFDVSALQHLRILDTHELVGGIGYRVTAGEIENGEALAFDPRHRTLDLVSLFVQDEITIVEDRLFATIGSKLEFNDVTGFEVQPSARLLWSPHTDHSIWLAVSRAVRTPSIAAEDVRLLGAATPAGPFGLTTVEVLGDRGVDSDELLAFEAGYRVGLLERLSLDLSGYVNLYEGMLHIRQGTISALPGATPPRLTRFDRFDNVIDGQTYGVEASARVRVTDTWSLHGGFSWFRPDLRKTSSSITTDVDGFAGDYPRHQAFARSEVALPGGIDLDTSLYWVDRVPTMDIASYVRWDVRLAWRPRSWVELSVVGQNLLDPQHPEWGTDFFEVPSEVPRSVYAQVELKF